MTPEHSGQNVEVDIQAGDWMAVLPEAEAVVERAARAALGSAKGQIAVLLTDDEAVQVLNARFRDRDRPTNVLSFPAAEMTLPGQPAPLGDLVLAFGVCRDEAGAQGKTLSDHVSHLVVHGVLHLLGRDHEDDAEGEAMEAEERSILARLGVADPYRADEPD